jgi:hypothetical protein
LAGGSTTNPGADARAREVRWQVDHMTAEVREALRLLPAIGSDPSGPLGPGLLARGVLGETVREIQAWLALPQA